MRVNKYLVEAGVCSRREADRLISLGEVTVNGRQVELGQKIHGDEDIVVKGQHIKKRSRKYIYLAYHKPVGVICTADQNAQGNIIQAVNFPERVFNIGRLDVASSGLILLTNDGELANKILSVEGQHEKEYAVTIEEKITSEFLQALSNGVVILGQKTLPAKVSQIDLHAFTLILVEGRNRQIRRMCEALHMQVKSLKRIRIMNIQLAHLPLRAWRHLTPKEEKDLFSQLALRP